MTYDDLAAMLEPVRLPIVMPGELTAALPCIALDPVGMGTADGFSFLYEECDVKVLVALNENNPAKFQEVHDYTVEVWRCLWGTQVQVDDDGPLFGQIEQDPAALYFQLSVRFPGEDLCPEPVVAPVAAPVEEEGDDDPE